jgi:hypothetical protein
MHALSRATEAPVPEGKSITHRERHAGSPLQFPRHDSDGTHVGSAEQVADSPQQLVATHSAQAFVPYGNPQAFVGSPTPSWMPTIWRQANKAAPTATAATHTTTPTHKRTMAGECSARVRGVEA